MFGLHVDASLETFVMYKRWSHQHSSQGLGMCFGRDDGWQVSQMKGLVLGL